ncbi:ATP-binding protein [Halomicrobium katesii]|uniref:ATP-binding protein n=1 Tax=Halomicrobium katesii TaxID=437163 RepID=UPI000377689A|nr:AAA family ATPase [Halomicrobium katesii]
MYDHGGEHLRAEFDRIRAVLERARAIEGASEEEVVSPTRLNAFAGEATSIDEADESVDIDARAEEIATAVEASHEEDVSLSFDTLSRAFDLSRAERDALLVVLGPEIDRSITKVYGEICGADTAMLPSVELVETVLAVAGHGATETNSASSRALAPTGPLFEYDILTRAARKSSQPASYDVLSVDDRIVDFLRGCDALGSALRDLVTLERHDRTLSDMVFDEQTTATLEAIRDRLTDRTDPSLVFLAGEDGTGKDRLPGALTDGPLLTAPAAEVVRSDELLTRLLREARLRDVPVHIDGIEAVTDIDEPTASTADDEQAAESADVRSVDDIVQRLDDAPSHVFVGSSTAWTPDVALETHHVETCLCPFPDDAVRERVWDEYADEFVDEQLVSHVATNFRLPQRDIRRAARLARYFSRRGVEGHTPEEATAKHTSADAPDAFAPIESGLTSGHLYEACKRYSASTLGTLAEPIDPGYAWEDLALADRQASHLRQLCGHLQYRGAVTSEWGFGEPGSRGDGVVALFYGQPGTGKTMAAEVIANETGLDLYRVDLSQIINKYVGETESRLATILDEAERSNAILLFDEADAIFGERADVNDATDRYANMEINFLLQRLESFDGILLLTTNKRSGIDSAFKRRIQHSIAFEKPQERVRQTLWRDAFPPDANVATDGFDYEFLSEITTTPALIRKVAKYAAYIAATEAHDGRPLEAERTELSNVTITFDHVVRALQYAREAGGAGFQVEFGAYSDKRRQYGTDTTDRDWRTELRRANASTTAEIETDSPGDGHDETDTDR